jgi:uncharacterized membrane protein
MWMAHHYPEDYDRCFRVAGRHLCRRCFILYPVAFVTLALAQAGLRWPRHLDPWLLVLLPLPGVIEFVAEHRHWIAYRPALQELLAVPMGIGLGVGFFRYLHHPGDLLFWGIVAVYAGVCAISALWRAPA